MTGPLLIVNADDYGLTPGLCQAILRAGSCGIVTSTSALANGPALRARRRPRCGIPGSASAPTWRWWATRARCSPPGRCRRSSTSAGSLPPSWRPFLTRCALGRVDPDDVRREFAAQVEVLRSHGLTLTHLDTHQNLHLWPSIARVTVELACSSGVGAMRVTRSAGRSPIALGVRHFSRGLESRARKAKVRFPSATAGFDESGRLDLAHLRGAIDRFATLRVSSAELVCHPGHSSDDELGALGMGLPRPRRARRAGVE